MREIYHDQKRRERCDMTDARQLIHIIPINIHDGRSDARYREPQLLQNKQHTRVLNQTHRGHHVMWRWQSECQYQCVPWVD